MAKKDIADELAKMSRQSILDACRGAVRIMNQFLRDATQRIDRAEADAFCAGVDDDTSTQAMRATVQVQNLSRLPSDVMHDLSWGLANAMGQVEQALSAVEGYRAALAARAVVDAEEQR